MSVQVVQPVAAPHVYRPRATPVTILIWVLLLLVAVLVRWGFEHFVFRNSTNLVGTLIWAVVLVSLMSWVSWAGTSLTIYADAFVYRTSGLTIQAYWRDVERIERRWWPIPLWAGDRLVLEESHRAGRLWKPLHGARERIVPLSVFDPHWREGPLGYDLRYFAPHLFDAEVPR